MRTNIFNKITNENILVFIFVYATIFGPAFNLFSEFNYDFIKAPDLKSYVEMAKLNFDQSPIHRYRVVIPLLVTGVNLIFEPVFNLLKPYTFPGPNFSLCMSFFVVNSFLSSLFGLIIYKISYHIKRSKPIALIVTLSIITSRWISYFTGLPFSDSLYLIVIALSILGIIQKNKSLIILSILLGPWAKESFIFFVPLLFFYTPLSKVKTIGWLMISGAIVFSFRFLLDKHIGATNSESLSTDLNHINYVVTSLKRLFSFHGAYELFSILGIWNIILIGVFVKKHRQKVITEVPAFSILFFGIILIHALLSTSIARMFFFSTPVLAIILSVLLHSYFSSSKSLTNLFFPTKKADSHN